MWIVNEWHFQLSKSELEKNLCRGQQIKRTNDARKGKKLILFYCYSTKWKSSLNFAMPIEPVYVSLFNLKKEIYGSGISRITVLTFPSIPDVNLLRWVGFHNGRHKIWPAAYLTYPFHGILTYFPNARVFKKNFVIKLIAAKIQFKKKIK